MWCSIINYRLCLNFIKFYASVHYLFSYLIQDSALHLIVLISFSFRQQILTTSLFILIVLQIYFHSDKRINSVLFQYFQIMKFLYLVLCPWICSGVSWFTVYGNLNRICILLECGHCINLNYVELVHSAFQVYCILLLIYIFILFLFESLILILQLKLLSI